MRGRNVRCRLEFPRDTRTDTGGRTRIWQQLPEFPAALSPLSASEQEVWEREVQNASYRLIVMGRAIPMEHHDKVIFSSRVVVLNRRNFQQEEIYDIVGVRKYLRAGRIKQFDLILGRIK